MHCSMMPSFHFLLDLKYGCAVCCTHAHFQTTGPEVWEATAGRVDYFIHGVGTGGCIKGAGAFLKEKKPLVKVIAVEPEEARVHVGAPAAAHSIVGIGAGFVTHFFGMNGVALDGAQPIEGVIDEWACASGAEAVAFAKKAAAMEGIMCGPTAGAALKVACEVASRPEARGKTIVVVLASHGIRYSTHPLWAAVKEEASASLPAPPNTDPNIPLVQARLCG